MADEELTNIDKQNVDNQNVAIHSRSSNDGLSNELQIDETNEAQAPIIQIADAPSTTPVDLEVASTTAEEATHDDIAIDTAAIDTAGIDNAIDMTEIEISERKSDTEHDAIELQHTDDDDRIDSNTPLKHEENDNADANSMILTEEEERDVLDTEPVSPKIYNEYMRRRSVSTSDIPHSLQVLTPQHIDRPKDDMLAQIYEMGFDRRLAEKAYTVLLSDNNGNHGAFTTEQVIEVMLSQDVYSSNEQIEVNIAEEKVEQVITKGGASDDCIECPICRIDRVPSDIDNATCGHNYCTECLEKHYKTGIENGIVSFVCMEQECERIIGEKELFEFVSDEVYKSKYYKFCRNVKLAKDPTIRWCVKAGCDTPIKRKSRKQRKLECPKCETIVCYECAGLYYNNDKNDKHNCNKNLDEKLSHWAKSKGDVAFCPRCAARIEKLSGCNHMRCSYCKYEFCWLCRKEFKKGHYDPSNIVFGCPGGENATKRPDRCNACCMLFRSCLLMCVLPFRICCWRMNEQGFPWCCCWCCCQD
eukprot:46843_1